MKKYDGNHGSTQAVSRVGLYGPVILLALIVASWSVFWIYSARRADQAIQNWMIIEARKGRQWSCEDRKTQGFPFRIELFCNAVRLQLADGRIVSTGALHAAAQVYSPSLVLADISSPFTIQKSEAIYKLNWDNFRLSLRYSGEGFERISANIKTPQLHGPDGPLMLTASQMEFHLRSTGDRSSIETAVAIADLEGPMARWLSGGQAKTKFDMMTSITNPGFLSGSNFRASMEQWRNSGGRFVLQKFEITQDKMTISSQGELQLDASGRPEGQIKLSGQNLRPIVEKLPLGNAQPLIRGLLERRDGSPVELSVRLLDGRLNIGPVRTPPFLPSIY